MVFPQVNGFVLFYLFIFCHHHKTTYVDSGFLVLWAVLSGNLFFFFLVPEPHWCVSNGITQSSKDPGPYTTMSHTQVFQSLLTYQTFMVPWGYVQTASSPNPSFVSGVNSSNVKKLASQIWFGLLYVKSIGTDLTLSLKSHLFISCRHWH